MTDEKIINRIKKMMALANDKAASDGERENALRMSYALMARHNLEMSDVNGNPIGPQEARAGVTGEFYARPWAITLCASVSRLFFCQYYRRSIGKDQAVHTFTGRESNAATAEEVARVLVESVRREANTQMRQRGENVTWRRSFSTGAAFKVQERVSEMMSATAAIEGTATGTALVLVNLRKQEELANQQFIASKGVKLVVRSQRARRSVDSSAYSQGRQFGSGLNLTASKKLAA
jgi:hypothetical protein